MDYEEMRRLKDEFFLEGRARPATAAHYVAWLEGYLDAGGKVDQFTTDGFPSGSFVTVSRNCQLPKLESYYGLHVIAPPGVTVDTSNPGDCVAYHLDASAKSPQGNVKVWSEMLGPLLEDGYALSQLVPAGQMASMLREKIISTLAHADRGATYYEAFAARSDFDTVKAQQAALHSTDVPSLLRGALKLPPKAPIDAPTQRLIDDQVNAAVRALDVLHYRHDPANEKPLAVFRRKSAKAASAAAGAPAADASVALASKMEVGPPLKFKKRRTKPGKRR